jgi:hypothetical protein
MEVEKTEVQVVLGAESLGIEDLRIVHRDSYFQPLTCS